MPASGTMVAPYGRVMSGRGFAPGSFQLYDIPSAGQFTQDLPNVGNKPNIDVWSQQAKMANSMQLFGKGFLNNSMRPVVTGPLLPAGPADDVEVRNPAKRQRLSIPEYGRSVSDPPLSFVRRSANAANMPVEALKLASLRRAPPPADLPKALRSIQSGPVRSTEGRPSPNYRIYSNAFQGGRVSGDGAPFNYSNSKAANASSMTRATLSSTHHATVNPTPHPALLKQPLLGKRPSSSSPALPEAQQQQQQPDQAVVCDSAAPAQQRTDAETSVAQAELTARLQHMQSIVRGSSVPKLSVSPNANASSAPQPTASPKHSVHSIHSVSHYTHSDQDTEMDDASHGSHGPSHGQASDNFKEPAGDTKGLTSVADAHNKSPHGSSRRSPAPFSRDSASPHNQGPTPFGDAISSRLKGVASSRDGASPRVYSGMPCGDRAEQGLGMVGQSQLKLPSRKSDSSRSDLAPNGHSERPWSNLSSALQPSVSPAVTNTEPVTTAQLQSIAASRMKKNGDHRDEAVVSISEANVEQWLSQLAEAPGKSSGQRPNLAGMTSQELVAAQIPNLPRPIQAELHVMRSGFNRVPRPNIADQPHLPTYSSAPVTASFPLGGLEHHRRLLAPKQEAGIPRVGSVNSMQPSLISSSTRSSLPPSVASWLEQDQQQRQQLQGRGQPGVGQQGYGFGRELGQGQCVASFSAVESPYGQHVHSGHTQGYAQSSRPLDSVRVNGGKDWYDNLGSGYSLPSRVIAEGGVRNPALLNRPVLSSHRDPQPGPRDSDAGIYRAGAQLQQGPSVLPQASGKSFSFLNSGASNSTAQRAQHDGLSPGAAAVSFPPNFSSMQNPAATPNMNTLAAMLGGSNLSPADVSQLCSLAGNRNAGDLNQLISQMLMASQLAQAQGESPPPLVETTHRVVIPSHAISRQNTASLASVQNPAATVADGGKHQQDRAVEAQPLRPKSALDAVADAAAAAELANEEPSELLMLAAETLAGLNMQPRSSGDQPRSASAGLDDSSDESPPLPARRPSKHPAVAKQRSRKMAPSHEPAGHTSSAAAAHDYASGASVHPVLGLYVPHARRSYHRDGTALGAKGSSMASSGHWEGRAPNGKGNMVGNDGQLEGRAPFASSRPHAAAPARGRQRKGLTAAAHAKPAAVMRRMPSDSSMTVSADSNA